MAVASNQSALDQLAAASSGALGPGPAPPAARPERVAVLVAHGMGQQVPFETLELVAESLRRTVSPPPQPPAPVALRRMRLGGVDLPRVELTLLPARPGGTPREVHIYETYWAPLTEGRISLRETVGFLLGAGIAGIGRTWSLRRPFQFGHFTRWMFGGLQRFEIGWPTGGAFLLAVLVVLSLVLLNATIAAVIGTRLVTGGGSRWPSGPLIADLTADMALLVAGAIPAVLALLFVARRRKRRKDGSYRLPGRGAQIACWVFIASAVAAMILASVLAGWHLWMHRGADEERLLQAWLTEWLAGDIEATTPPAHQVWKLAFTWGILIALHFPVRGFLVQYVGDVAIYLTAHRVSRYEEVREAIKERSRKVAKAIYTATDPEGEPLEALTSSSRGRKPERVRLYYDGLVVVGHSLGSVIAFDTLNDIVRDDLFSSVRYRVADRTLMLCTFGSPLDKAAFIFRTQQKKEALLREVAVALRLPLIFDYAHRPRRWVNIYSNNDWICGKLNFYDTRRPDEGGGKRVENVPDPCASTPLAAHNEYWTNPRLGSTLLEAVRVELRPVEVALPPPAGGAS